MERRKRACLTDSEVTNSAFEPLCKHMHEPFVQLARIDLAHFGRCWDRDIW